MDEYQVKPTETKNTQAAVKDVQVSGACGQNKWNRKVEIKGNTNRQGMFGNNK